MIASDSKYNLFTDHLRWADVDDWNRCAVELHAQGGIHRIEHEGFPPFWAVIDHESVLSIERQAALFTNAPRMRLQSDEDIARTSASPLRTMLHMDGEEHRAYRGLAADWFKPSSLRRLDDRLNELTAEAIAKLEALGGECDFAADIAMAYPLQVILKILGLPEQDYGRMWSLTQEFFGNEDADMVRDNDPENARAAVIADFMKYFIALRNARRDEPTDDLATVIATGEIDGTPLEDFEAVSYYVVMATAGHDTTSAAMSGGIHALAEHPDQLRRVQDDPELVNNAVEEMLRWSAPVRHFMRTAQEDTEILGQEVAAGDWIYLSYKAANLDPKVFEDPLVFDVARANASRNISFGFGAHFCLGAQLARNELRNLFGQLIPRLESLELAGTATTSTTSLVGGLKSLPIRYELR